MHEHRNERNIGEEENAEFERFLRQFTLREASPLPVAAAPQRGWMAWMLPAPRWVYAAALLAVAVGLPLAVLRNSGGAGNSLKVAPAPGADVRPGQGPALLPVTPRTVDDSGQVERVALRQAAGVKIAADLGGPDRYLTHVATDKPIYRAGERLYVRGVILRGDGHTPMPVDGGVANIQGYSGTAYIEIKGPKGDTVFSGSSAIIDSTVGFSWDVPADQTGGEYTVRISNPFTGDAPAERKFDIRAYRAPRLKSQIVFVRDGYGPGDTVAASLHVERAEGGIPASAKVSVSARVDGEETWKGETRVDGLGNAGASFKLPAAIARGEGTLAMIIEDGGTVETAAKTIPILLRTLDLGIYPEGGDLVAGLSNRVYLEGRTPAAKPSDIAGIVVNAAGRPVAQFRTEHEGRGRFSFIPAKGESYSLRVTEPSGIKTLFPLPAVKEAGVVIAATSDVIARQKDIVVRVVATGDGVYDVALSQRGKDIAFTSVTLKAGLPVDVTLTVPKSLDGVLVATVYDDRGTPAAERVLFRQPDRSLKVRLSTDQADFVPGGKVTLHLATTDDAGKPVGAVVGLTVTDSSVLEMIEKRAQAPRLPAMALLENDVKNLSDAHVYLDPANPKAALATDLLLGTQGWRRFAAVDPSKFVAANGDAARRALAIRVRPANSTAMLPSFTPATGDIGNGVVVTLTGSNFNSGGFAILVTKQNAQDLAGLFELELDQARNQFERGIARAFNFSDDALVFGIKTEGVKRYFDGRGGPFDRNLNQRYTPVVREYAHALRPDWAEGSRSDFAETVYWNAGVKTDASTGLAAVSFNLSDAVTTFKVLADGFTQDGTLGSGAGNIESVRPFFIEPKLPLQVTSGDVIQLPVSMINAMSRELAGAEVALKAGAGIKITGPGDNSAVLRAKERARRLVQIDVPRDFSGVVDLTLDGKAGPYRDSVGRKLEVQPLGYPYEASTGGMLPSKGAHSFEFTLPAETLSGSIASSVMIYPTPLASMTEALQALLREPYGCFEQTSSTSYPMVMAQQYFVTHAGVEPAIIEKAKGFLDSSYKRLTGFESRSHGYEWFGADPGHEALTAYGLLQFTDMAQVRDVDKDMVQRTRNWLLARRDGNGGFSRDARSHGAGMGSAPADTANAYIAWALVESGEKGLAKEIALVKGLANSTADSYIIALGANVLHAAGDKAGARQLLDKLAKAQDTAGNVKGALTGITRSGGDSLAIETTALSVLAWLRDPAFTPNVEKGMKWIVESNKSGRFGSTQSTVLALRAIVAYDAAHARPKAPGRVLLLVDGKPVGAPVAFTADSKSALVMPEFGADLGVGKHTVALRMEDGSDMPFSISVKYHTSRPGSAEQTRIGIQVAIKDPQMREGGITEAKVSIVNKSNEAIPTPVAIVGIPGGLEVRHDQLKELVKSGKIAAYEVIGREVVLYWRFIKANDKFDLPLSLVAAVPGTYTGPASRAYLYYTDEYKNWAPGLKVTIAPRL